MESELHAYNLAKKYVTENNIPRKLVTLRVEDSYYRLAGIDIGDYFKYVDEAGNLAYIRIIGKNTTENIVNMECEDMTDLVHRTDADCRMMIKYLPGMGEAKYFNSSPLFCSKLTAGSVTGGTVPSWTVDGDNYVTAFSLNKYIAVTADSVQHTYFNPTLHENFTVFWRMSFSSVTTTGLQSIFAYATGADTANYFYILRKVNKISLLLRIANSNKINQLDTGGTFNYDTYYNFAMVKVGTKYAVYYSATNTLTQKSYIDTGAITELPALGAHVGTVLTANSLYASLQLFYVSTANAFGALPNIGKTDTITIPERDLLTVYSIPA
jgi:hypothetical protein